MHIFYQPDIAHTHSLPDEEAHHCVRVLRHKGGDTLHITDGNGRLYKATLEVLSKSKHQLRGLELIKEEAKAAYHVHIAIAPTKNADRLEWFLEKAIEFGLDELSLLQCAHSERSRLNLDRLSKKAVSAMKQSLHLKMPVIHPLEDFSSFLKRNKEQNQDSYIAYVDEQHDQHLFQQIRKGKESCILIGPEGDFSAEEIQQAIGLGFKPVSLGKSRLRTETAALAACHMVHLANL